jgi:hypothetical protein
MKLMAKQQRLLSLAVAVALGATAAPGSERGEARPIGETRVDLAQYSLKRDDFPEATFSASGGRVCVWWGPQMGHRPNFLVFDGEGRLLARTLATNDPIAMRDFPLLAWWGAPAEFLARQGHRSVAFSRDLSLGLRIVAPTISVKPFVIDDFGTNAAEMWHVDEPMRRLWSEALPDKTIDPKPFGPLNDWPRAPVLINLNGETCAELDAKTGKIKKTFEFGPIESDEEAERRARRFGELDDSAGFFAGTADYDRTHDWIACGCSHDRRVRVIARTAPTRVIFEANSNANPYVDGVPWNVREVSFLAQGRYLEAVFTLSHRYLPFRHETEIYDTASWRTAWKTKDSSTRSVTLSPDGRKLAYISLRGPTLVIQPFEPTVGKK